MASPQCEDGFTKIANELLEALARIRIPGEAMQIFLVILRKTYGFSKKEDAISLSQFSLATGLLKSHICDSLRKLKAMNLITENGNDIAKTYSINKDFSIWKPLPKKVKVLPNSVKKNKDCQQIQGKASDDFITENGNDGKTVTKIGKNHYRIQLPQKKKETTTSSSKISFDHETGKFVNLDGNIGKWQLAYKGIDVLSEFSKMVCWLKANPKRSKTNWERFIVNWLSRTHEKLISGNGNGKRIPQRHTGVVL